jgi:hypothetical protein
MSAIQEVSYVSPEKRTPNQMPEDRALLASTEIRRKTMHRRPLLTLTIFAPLLLISLATAQPAQRPSETVKKDLAVRAAPAEATAAKRVDKKSREYAQMVADKNFLAACEVVLADGEKLVPDSGQISQEGPAFTITHSVVNEGSGDTGQYRQLVYAFDGKEAKIFFQEKNERYAKSKAVGPGAKKIKFPPDWWPGSGGGSTGLGGGTSWSDWHQVSIDNCHANFFCPVFHMGKMRQEERVSNSNSSIKQTRWILISCGCN